MRWNLQAGTDALAQTLSDKKEGAQKAWVPHPPADIAVIKSMHGSKQLGAWNQNHFSKTGTLLNVSLEFGAVFPLAPTKAGLGVAGPNL